MMHNNRREFWTHLYKVIFVLSTIVAVTDCCSSRILLLREHTLKIVQHNFHNHLHEHAHELQQQIEQHVANMVTQMELNKTYTQEIFTGAETQSVVALLQPIETPIEAATTPQPDLEKPPPPSSSSPKQLLLQPPPSLSPSSQMSSDNETATTIVPIPQDSSTRKSIDNPNMTAKFNMSDIYYTIMRDVLSLECSGQYLTDFCLNGGRCFRYPVANHSFFSCECADGYIGERCESKSLNEMYVPSPSVDTVKPKVLMARIVFSFPMLMLFSTIYIVFGAFVVFRSPHSAVAAKYQRTAGMFIS